MLSDEPLTLLAYRVKSVVLEMVDTMIRGDANTRKRDYANVLLLSKTHALELAPGMPPRPVRRVTALSG